MVGGALNIAEVKELVALMADAKVMRLKTPDIELEMSPLGFSLPEPTPAKQGIGEESGYPTEEELLFASSPLGPPEVKAKPPEVA